MLQGFYSGRNLWGMLFAGATFFAASVLLALGTVRLLGYIGIGFHSPLPLISICALSSFAAAALCPRAAQETGRKFGLAMLSVLSVSILVYALVA